MNKITNYIKDSWAELKKVSWPSKQETYKNTIMVIAVSLAVALFLGIVDYALNIGLEQLIKIKPKKSENLLDIQETPLSGEEIEIQEQPQLEINPDTIEAETGIGESVDVSVDQNNIEESQNDEESQINFEE